MLITMGLGMVSAVAQTTPGDISRQVEPARPSVLPQLQMHPPRLTQPSAPEAGVQLVRIQQWVLQGNQMLSTETLEALLQPFSGVDMSIQQIREAAAVVQQAYDEAGWLARVDVPTQDITDGRVTLQITEARMGRLVVDPNATSRVNFKRVKQMIEAHQPSGQALFRPQLERALLLADDLSGINLVGSLQSGVQPGTTDLAINSTSQPAYALDLSADNTNARVVGANKVNLIASWVSPAGYGEAYSAQAFVSEGSEYLRLGVSTPFPGYWGSRGLKASVYLSQMDYKIVTPDGDGNKQDISGTSQTASADLAYPLVRSRQANVYVTTGLEQRRYRGQANGQPNSRYGASAGQVGLSGNFFDNWLGSIAATTYGITWRQGRVGVSKLVDVDNTQVQGSYKKTNWNVSRQQALSANTTLFVSAQGQRTGNKVLDSSENMSLGGASGVRAYPAGEASGPQGHVINLEVRYRINSHWLLTPFYDRGRIEKRTVDDKANYSLHGVGASLGWTGPRGWAVKATYARRIGSNPNANADTGNDQDGSLIKDRVWVTVARRY